MSTHRRLPLLLALSREFWLILFLLLVALWIGGESVTNQVLSRSYDALDKLQADSELEVNLALNILFITAEIDREQGFTTVDIKTTDSELKKLEFQLPLTEYKQLETAIAEKLGLSLADIRQLVRYQVKS